MAAADEARAGPTAATRGGGSGEVALDELMMAMDVVDTLRHEERLVEDAFAQTERDRTLKGRLRAIYEGQGLAVSDEILEEGIRALRENRFVYEAPPPGARRTLAALWVRRGRVGAAVGAVAVVLVVALGARIWSDSAARRAERAAAVEISETLPAALARDAATARGIAATPAAVAAIEAAVADGEAALAARDAEAARAAVARLSALGTALRRRYEIRVVNRPGTPSGVFRVPDRNPDARNHYLVVEAIGPDGAVLELPVTSEEDGSTRTVTMWGQRVPESVFEAVRRDKADDGIVQDDRLGEKRLGAIAPEWTVPVSGGAITAW